MYYIKKKSGKDLFEVYRSWWWSCANKAFFENVKIANNGDVITLEDYSGKILNSCEIVNQHRDVLEEEILSLRERLTVLEKLHEGCDCNVSSHNNSNMKPQHTSPAVGRLIKYGRKFVTGQYQTEYIELEAVVREDQSEAEVFSQLKNRVLSLSERKRNSKWNEQ